MSLNILTITPHLKDAPMIADPILSILVATDEEYSDAWRKRNHRDEQSMERLRAITAKRLEMMKKVARTEAAHTDDSLLLSRAETIQAMFDEEASHCLDHGMMRECAAHLRASNALASIIQRLKSNS